MLLFGHGYSLGIYRQFTLLLLTTFEISKKDNIYSHRVISKGLDEYSI